MSAVTGPDFLALQVDDLEQAAAFYEQKLGLERAPVSPPGAVVFATRPIPFAVREPLPGTDLESGQTGLGVALWLRCDDAQAIHDALSTADVPIVAEPVDGPFGRTFSFRDPDGYVITVHDGG
jgi:predicted enzyme related to lactoylglutathione lyase